MTTVKQQRQILNEIGITFQKWKFYWASWLKLVILVTWEVAIRRIKIQGKKLARPHLNQ
jgi:hypothetical protein